ncbi:spore protein [Virgibacillus sp. NKC19-16]|nr:spore protein [Virgibacillus sp. NKC19-16]UJL48066.1 spore protein [Virgibacillus sp. NKC19-16]
MKHKKTEQKKGNNQRSKSLKTGDKKLNGPNRPST